MSRDVESRSRAVQSVDRAMRILEALASAEEPGLGVVELSKRLQVPKSTIHRILSTLVGRGYVRQDAATRRYESTLKILKIAGLVQKKTPLCNQARSHLRGLMQDTGENVALVIRDYGEAIVVDQLEYPDKIQPKPEMGTVRPLHCTAAGKVIAASMSARELREATRGRGLERFTRRTIDSYPALHKALTTVRSQGYGMENEEQVKGIRGVAAPIRDRDGAVIGSVEIRGPTVRISGKRLKELAKYVVTVANNISASLGYDVGRIG